MPRTSYNQVRTVGDRRQYGGQQHAQPYVPPQQQAPYGQPHAQYAAPETYGAQPPRQTPPPAPQRGGSGQGPNTKGLLIGAVAVVAVVVVGIAAAVLTNKDKGTGDDKAGGTTPARRPPPGRRRRRAASRVRPRRPRRPAQAGRGHAQLGGPAKLDTAVKGAKGPGGAYVVFNGEGGSASWTVDVPDTGDYTLRIVYSVPGKDAKTSLTVNGEKPREINMANWAKAPEGDWEKGWTYTYAYVKLNKGSGNSLKISCEPGNSCDAILDQVYLEAGKTGKG